jgi:excisionase family DNA binding protein
MKESQTNFFGKSPRAKDGHQLKPTSEMKFFTVEEVASFFAVSLRSVRRWIADEKLVVHHFGRAVRIAESDLRAFIAAHRAH